ncbi:MAG TPA: exopolysaccharide Pel transporter PelG [Bradyrhizobium sp.]|nr:exopolysaccharide Pel transporter PelG [Bradyrhizobium sp.]
MINVNVTIEAMTRRGSLSGVFGAYLYAALLVAGPWIFTVVGLLGVSMGRCEGTCADLTVFRSVVIHNSMYALVVTCPLAFLSGRYVSEQLHGGSTEGAFFALVLSLIVFGLLTLGIVAPFYMFATTLDPAEKVASIQNAAMIGCSWLLIPFLGAFRAYNTVLIGFGSGAASMLVIGSFLRDPQALSLLLGFNGSFAITNLILLSGLVRRFGTTLSLAPELGVRLSRLWELPVAGAAYALGLWIDKFIMWHSAPSGRLVVAGALRTMPSYDTATFWAQLSSIPVIAVFFVHVETRFSSLVRTYHKRMQDRASLRELNEIVGRIGNYVRSSMLGLFAALVAVAAMMIMFSLAFMTELGLQPDYMGILRVALCSMTFYTSAMFCFTLLLYLDLRRPALLIVSTFLALNAVLTFVLLPFGPDFYGYGNMIAATVSLLVGFGLIVRELSWLHYHAFITNNSSL